MIHTPQTPGWMLSRPIDQPFSINYDSRQAAGLVALWTCFNQRGVEALRDPVGTYDMTPFNTPTISNDFEMGPVVEFTVGNSEYLELDRAAVTGTPLTITCWFNSFSVTIAQSLVQIGDKDAAADLYALSLRGNAGGDPVTGVRIAGGGPSLCNTTTGYLANTWHHAAMVCWNDTDCDTYIDGGSKGTEAAARAPAAWDRTSIGRSGDSTPGNYFSGRIAEVRVYNRAMTDAEVWQLYAPETRWELYRPAVWFMGAAVTAVRIPRPPAAYNTLAIY